MQIGVVGLPNVGKTTLFNAITRAGAEVGAYPFTTKSSNVGVAEVPDGRLYKIAEIAGCRKTVPTHIKFLDIAGLVKGASKGEGLGNQFLGYIRDTDAIAHVVRCFADEDISHVDGKVEPVRDMETVNLELALADLSTLEKAKGKTAKSAKSGDKEASKRLEVLKKVESALNEGTPVRLVNLDADENSLLAKIKFLTSKPVIYVANISEEDIGSEDNPLVDQIKNLAEREKAAVVVVSAKIESEVVELGGEEAEPFLKDLGISELGLEKLVKASYRLLDLITFFTTESSECRAWTVKRGTKAPQAAGKIHTDMEKGFVKAEVVHFQDLVAASSFHAAREQGHLLLEGKEYVVQDGDVIYFKFAT